MLRKLIIIQYLGTSETSESATTMTITPAPTSAGSNLQPEIMVLASSTPNDSMVAGGQDEDDDVSSTAAQMAEDLAAAISSHLNRNDEGNLIQTTRTTEVLTSEVSHPPASIAEEQALPQPPSIAEEQALPPPPPPPYMLGGEESPMRIIINPGAVSSDDDENEENSGSLPAALAPLSPSPEQSEAIGDRDVTMRSENASPQRPSQDEEQRSQESEISTGVSFVRVLQLISLFLTVFLCRHQQMHLHKKTWSQLPLRQTLLTRKRVAILVPAPPELRRAPITHPFWALTSGSYPKASTPPFWRLCQKT